MPSELGIFEDYLRNQNLKTVQTSQRRSGGISCLHGAFFRPGAARAGAAEEPAGRFRHRLPNTEMVRPGSPTEALQAAMDAERRSCEFFRHYANQVNNPQGRAIFEKFAEEKKRHLTVIREAYDDLSVRTRL